MIAQVERMNSLVIYIFLLMGLVASIAITLFVLMIMLKIFLTKQDSYSQGLTDNPIMITIAIFALLAASFFSFHGAQDSSKTLTNFKTGIYKKGVVVESKRVHTCDGYEMRYKISYTGSNGISYEHPFSSAVLYDIGEEIGVYYMPESPNIALLDNVENGNMKIALLYAISICFFSLFLLVNMLAFIKCKRYLFRQLKR